MVIQSNKISLALQDADTAKSVGTTVPNAKDGGSFRIAMGVTMDGPVQNETGNGTGTYTEAEARQLHIEGETLSDDSQMSPADFISRCTAGEDAQALSDEETPLEEYTSSQLDRAIRRIREERRENTDAVEHQVEREREKAEAVQETAVASVAEGQISPFLLEQMQKGGLPITPENVMRLSRAMEMTADIGSFTEASMKFFVSRELSPTPENIRSSRYDPGAAPGQPEPVESDFAEMEEQVRALLAVDGAEPDEEAMQTARWLYENDLPVTPEHVRTCEGLERLKRLEPERLSARIVDNMADGVPPEKADLMKLSVAEAVTARRRLEEARLTMSIEAVRNMSAKGIDLDISHLEQIVDELKIQEQQAKQALLEETDLPVTEDNARVMGDTLQAAKQVLAAPLPFLGKAMESPDMDTLRSLSREAAAYTADFARAEQSYEAVGTEVRRDLGDSMQKAFRNVGDILEDMGLEDTENNQRAIRSLAYNRIPLTEENVLRMKEYDSRITSLMKEMRPPVVAELIRRNVNPLEVSLDELLEQTASIREELGTEDISFSRYLWKLDHQKAVTPEERETMIGVYRLLDKIKKSDGAAAGQLLKEGRELSLGALLSAVRSRRRAGMDIQVDDAFGGLEQTVVSGTSISDQIRSAYQRQVARDLQKSLSPSVLREHGEEDLSLEKLLELCREEDSGDLPYYEEMAREWRETAAVAGERIQQFLADLDLPDTMANLQFAQEFFKQGSKDFRSYWEPEDSREVLRAFDEPEQLDEVFAALDEKQKGALRKIREADDIKYEDIRNAVRMGRRISFYGRLRNYQMYEVPVFTGQGVTECRVTVRSGPSKGAVEVAMDSPEFGRLHASFQVHAKHIKGFVTVEDKEKVPLCRTRMDEFEKDLEENGYTMDSGALIAGSRDSLQEGNRADGAKNSELYLIAKRFIITMNRKDDAE